MFGARARRGGTAGITGNTLHLHVTGSGYRVRLPGQSPDVSGDLQFETGTVPIERAERILRDAVGNLGERAARRIDSVAVLLDGPLVVTRDARDRALSSVSDARAREVGAQLLSCRESSFGKVRFGTATSANPRAAREVFSFIDLNSLKRLLAAMDQLAVHVREVVPTEFMLMRRAAAGVDAVYAGVYIGGEDTLVCLAEPATGTVVTRHIHVGTNTLVRSVASASGISAREALAGLARRDYFEALGVDEHGMPRDASPGSVEAGLVEPLRALRTELLESVGYLTSQLGLPAPREVELFGDAPALPGLDAWLCRGFGELRVEPTGIELFDEFVRMPREAILNLLSGSAGGLFTSGKLTYEFRNNQFVAAEQSNSDGSDVPRALQSRAASRRNRQRRGLFARGPSSGASKQAAVNERIYPLGLGVLVLALVYNGYDMLDTRAAQHSARVDQYHAVQRQLQLAQSADGTPGGPREGATVPIDKVFWAEKFLAISRHINNNLWLTDLFVVETRERDALRGQRLVMQGAALPSHVGHIQHISCFARALEADGPGFMDDFRQITFGGSDLEQGDAGGEGVVKFTLSATYLGEAQQRPAMSAEALRSQRAKLEECGALAGTTAQSG